MGDVVAIPGFRIERRLGSGGMATVYLATQLSLQREVALKILAPQLAADADFIARFVREGRIAASLRHRHIVPIHDVGAHEGVAYMALAYMPHGSIVGAAGTMSSTEVLRVGHEIALALDLAHRHGVVHRDVKPGNILRDADGGFVLSDFGIAQLASASQVVTKEGATVGTPAYMAPEQWRNAEIDGRADLYSLGVVLYQLLTGRLPYSGSDGWAIGMQHLQAPLPRLPEALRALQPLLDRLLAKDPEERFASGGALAREIERLQGTSASAGTGGQGASAPWRARPEDAAGLFATEPELAPRSRAARIGLASGAVLVLALGAALVWRAPFGRASLDKLLGAGGGSIATVAVLPCEAHANVAEHRELGDTLAEELIHRLGRLRALTVIARSSSFPLRDANLTARVLGERLGATHLLTCTIRRAPDGVRIAAELVEVKSGAQRWSAEYDRAGDELVGVVDELAVGISRRLLENLAGADRALLIRHRTETPEAIRLVEQGRALARQGGATRLPEARALIERAAGLDRDYAGAQLALAELAALEAGRDTATWRERAEPLLERALELDPELGPAYAARAQLRCAGWDFAGCRADVERALALDPGDAGVQATAARYQGLVGSRERAVEHASRRVRIEPETPAAWDELAATLLRAGRARESLAAADQDAARFPEHWPAHRARAAALERLGRCGDGLEAHERALKLALDAAEAKYAAPSLYVCAGRRERAAALLRELEMQRASGDPVPAASLARAYLALGQPAPAFDTMEAMAQARDPDLFELLDIAGRSAAGEPRVRALVESLRLPVAARP